MRKLPRRHPAFWLFDRYKPYHRLLQMSPARERLLDGEGSPTIVVWRIGKSMQVGVVKEVVDVLSRHRHPTEEFAKEIVAVLKTWMETYPQYRGDSIDAAGVWGGQMEQVAEMRINGMWERWTWRQQRISMLLSYAHACVDSALNGHQLENRREFGLSSYEAGKIRDRVGQGINRHGHRFDPRKTSLDGLI